MPLTLITGPANAAKAGAVLERLRAALAREPVLVVPTSADERHYARELAGARARLRRRRDDVPAADARHRAQGRACAGGRWAGSPAAGSCGRRSATCSCASWPRRRRARASRTRSADLFAELQRSLAGPARFGAAVRAWREAGTAPAARGASWRRCTPPTTGGSRRSGAVDEDGLDAAGAERRCARPGTGGRCCSTASTTSRPRSSTWSRRSSATRTPRSPSRSRYEPGRAAMAGSATTVELLKPLAREHVMLEAALRALRAERPRRAAPPRARAVRAGAAARVPPNGAVRLLEAGGERAEAELVGASVLELLRDGMAPEDIAVLVRSNAELFAQVFETYAIPVARERRVPFAHTRLGAGLLAFARAALGEGTAMDVVTWLRTPGKLASAQPRADAGPPRRLADADRLEVAIRRAEARHRRATRATTGRKLGGRELVELDALAAAPRASRRSSPRCWPRARRSGPRRTSAAAPCSIPTPRPTPARRASCARAVKELLAPARAGPGARRRAEGHPRRRSPRPRCARPRASPTARPACCSPIRWRSARAASARSSSAGCRRASCRGARSPSRSSTTARGRRWRSPPGSCSAATRPRCRASARCSTPASRARRRRCS